MPAPVEEERTTWKEATIGRLFASILKHFQSEEPPERDSVAVLLTRSVMRSLSNVAHSGHWVRSQSAC